jgi:hypothetical protein
MNKVNKNDSEKIVAYIMAFEKNWYGYPTKTADDFFDTCCEDCSILTNQIKDYEIPEKSIGKSKFAELGIFRFAVNEEIKNLLIKTGAKEEDFRPVYTSKKKLIAFQIDPVETIQDISKEFNLEVWDKCNKSGLKTFVFDDSEKMFLSKEKVEKLSLLNKTSEGIGRLNAPIIIVNIDAYNTLIKNYPTMSFIPVFEKN